ncbi:hypothetical protein HZA57_05310 [Candidatus Poribacteria bacterium]|nr:hypothetical protein [Candidatus Poribacteria bacterium]
MPAIRLSALLFTCLVALLGAGCMTGSSFTGAAGPPSAFFISDNLGYPAVNTSSTVYNLDTDDFEIRGTVVVEGHAQNIFGLFASGDNGYELLLKEARDIGCDDVINVRTDVHYTNYFFFYYQVRTVLSGQAIKWKN